MPVEYQAFLETFVSAAEKLEYFLYGSWLLLMMPYVLALGVVAAVVIPVIISIKRGTAMEHLTDIVLYIGLIWWIVGGLVAVIVWLATGFTSFLLTFAVVFITGLQYVGMFYILYNEDMIYWSAFSKQYIKKYGI